MSITKVTPNWISYLHEFFLLAWLFSHARNRIQGLF
jgi:hypothetical protein